MADTPWLGDACSLVDAYRSGQRSPKEELEACLAAIESSELNAFCFLDVEQAREAADRADVDQPFGGVPLGIKELDKVEGWPDTEASVLFEDRLSDHDNTMVERLRGAGVVPVGLTTASEFGGLPVSKTKLHGTTGNAWDPSKTAGGSSGGSSAAVAGGLVPIATGSDGGGSIRIPAAYNGLVGMKGTAGRIPRGPRTTISPLTVVFGCVARSVRDIARWYDVCNGHDGRDPYSLPRVEGWERDLGSHDLRGMRVAIAPDGGVASLDPGIGDAIERAGRNLADSAGLRRIDLPVRFPVPGVEWAMANVANLKADLGDLYPRRAADLTDEVQFGLFMAGQLFDLDMAGRIETKRTEVNEAMAALFDEVDFVVTTTNPGVAHDADVVLHLGDGTEPVGVDELLAKNGPTTVSANISGNPAISIPAATIDGLPVGMQVVGRQQEDALLLDLASAFEQAHPWPPVAPGAPR